MEQTNILVTGGCGFIGTSIISALLATKRYNITAIDLNPPSLGSTAFTHSVRYVRCDILDVSSLRNVFREARPAIVVHTSIAETHTLSSSTPSFATCALRPAPTFGPTDTTIIPTIHACIPTYQTPFILGNGTNLHDYVYVENVAYAHVLAVSNLLGPQTAAGEAIFITNGEPITLRDLCRGVWRQFGHVPGWEVRVPEGVAWWAGETSRAEEEMMEGMCGVASLM
ncbi:hypothetical protein CFE70_005880 [Pyrenophora teres f. teres 0-1]